MDENIYGIKDKWRLEPIIFPEIPTQTKIVTGTMTGSGTQILDLDAKGLTKGVLFVQGVIIDVSEVPHLIIPTTLTVDTTTNTTINGTSVPLNEYSPEQCNLNVRYVNVAKELEISVIGLGEAVINATFTLIYV